MIDLAPLIEQATELAPLSATTVRLAQVASRSDCDVQEVTELVAFDQALTSKLLRAANAVASGSAIPVGTVDEAVTRLGTAQVLALAVAAGAKPLLQARVPAYGLDEGALWRHSVASAVAAETAPRFCNVEVPPESFTAALLHDVGKLVMGRYLSSEILRFIHRAQEVEHLEALEAESLLLGVNHGELGGIIAQHWELPERIIAGITFHHNPPPDSDVICYLTCLANQVAKWVEGQLDGRHVECSLCAETEQRLGLTETMLEKFCPAAASRYEQVSRRYNAV